jgi:hypothetical protein
MNTNYLNRLLTFTENDLPDLDEVVVGALSYLEALTLPSIRVTKHTRPLVVGSGNALSVGKILSRETDAVCVDESVFKETCAHGYFDAVYIISASGAKHADGIAEEATLAGIPVYLITSTEHSPASALLPTEHTFVYPHVREPYTYNTSTYLAMLYGNERVSPERVRMHIETVIDPLLSDLQSYTAFLMVVPTAFSYVCSMYEIKFDELFGPYILGRATTSEGVKHAKTIVTAPHQCLVSFGEEVSYGNPGRRLTIPLFDDITYPEMIAIGYYVIGKIQKAHEPYFKENIQSYVTEAGAMFGHTIPVIVE